MNKYRLILTMLAGAVLVLLMSACNPDPDNLGTPDSLPVECCPIPVLQP